MIQQYGCIYVQSVVHCTQHIFKQIHVQPVKPGSIVAQMSPDHYDICNSEYPINMCKHICIYYKIYVCIYILYVCVHVCMCVCVYLCMFPSSPDLFNNSGITLQCSSAWNVTSSMFSYNITWILNYPSSVMAALNQSIVGFSSGDGFPGEGGNISYYTTHNISVCLCCLRMHV